jgi:ribonuclease P protein component
MPGGRETATSPQRSGRGRLSRSAEFDRVFRHGRSHAGRDLVLYVFPRGETGEEPSEPRLGMTVSRKVAGAVERNRIKRVLREAFARESGRLPAGTDAVVIARTGARELAVRDGLGGIQAALAELIDKVPGAAPRPAEVAVGAPAIEELEPESEPAESVAEDA